MNDSKAGSVRARLAARLPFYYGWVIIANTVVVSFSTRTVMAVATLSVFVVPMTEQLGWSRALFSGAVSLGGLCAVVVTGIFRGWARGTRARHRKGGSYPLAFGKLVAANRPRYGGYVVHLAVVMMALSIDSSANATDL